MKNYPAPLIFFLLLLAGSSLFTLGSGETPWQLVWEGAVLRMKSLSGDWNPLLDERLPRLIVLLCTGASLAVSGAVIQSLFHNPLASPSILGISSGGCLIVVLVFIFGLHHAHPYILPLSAFLGCLATLCLVYNLSRFQKGTHVTNLVLTGVAVSTFIIAIQGLILYALRDNWQLIQTITEWESGSSIDRGWQHVHMQLPLTIVGLLGCWRYRQEMNILALGEEEAKNLGVEVKKVRWRLFLFISLLTGGALAGLGLIAFFGLVLPHIIRRLQGPNHLCLIPLCMLGGAAILASLDILLRIFNLHALSIGNFSAIIGGAFFLGLLFNPQGQKI